MIKDYDFICIFDPSLGDDHLKENIQKISSLVVERGGEIISCDVWGRKKLAYSIQKKRDGFFVYMKIKLPPSSANELKKEIRLTEGLLRSSIIRIDEKR